MPDKPIMNDLFHDFAKHTRQDWLKAAALEAEGKNPDEALSWKVGKVTGRAYYDKIDLSENNFQLPPAANPYLGNRAWNNLPLITVQTEEQSNKIALNHLQNGADGVLFDIRTKPSINLDQLLEGIEWPYCMIGFWGNENSAKSLNSIPAFIQKKKWDSKSAHGFFIWDSVPKNTTDYSVGFDSLPNFRVFTIQSEGTDAVAQVSDLISKGITLLESTRNPKQIAFSISIGTDYFLEIAKLKALKFLWLEIANSHEKSFQLQDVFVHGQSEPWINDNFQPNSNMLKSTIASMAAIAGGCDALTVYPEKEEDSNMNRIARNVSNVLREESHFSKVADATAGAYYVESLTNQIIQQVKGMSKSEFRSPKAEVRNSKFEIRNSSFNIQGSRTH